MKGKDLLTNIQEARENITRLKREASLLEEQQGERSHLASQQVKSRSLCQRHIMVW